MFQRLRNGWELTKASARALDADRELLVFPFVAAIATVLVIASFAVPIALTGVWRAVGDDLGGRIVGGVVAWSFYFVLSLVTIYCNTALVGAALVRLDGGDPTLRDGLRVANSRLSAIVGYAAIAATVGLLLKAAERGGKARRAVVSLVGVAWSLATFLVVPVLAATGLGPIEAIKQSTQLFRRTWGETLAGAGGIKIVAGLATVGLVMLALPSVFFAVQSGEVVVAVAVISVFVLALVALSLVAAALQGVFTAALYRYATTGQPGFGFDPGALAGAFARRAA